MDNLRVFIAEDDPVVLMGCKSMLRILNHTICGSAMDGNSAVQSVLELKPDIVIMDINMPGCDGITAADQITEKLDIPIILVTGYQDENFINRSTKSRVYYYLQKPIDEYDLKSAISISYARHQDSLNLRNNLSEVSSRLEDAHEELHEVKKELDTTKQALNDRKIIEKAKGVLIDKFGMPEVAAMKYLQTTSQKKNIKIVAVAQDILRADKEFNF
ncbi:MAG: response regulator [Clostridium sp.]|nr:response regulator [Clostridium sp.]